MNLYNVPYGCNFLHILGKFLVKKIECGLNPLDMTVILPTKLAVSQLIEHLKNISTNSLFLPNITSINGDFANDYSDNLAEIFVMMSLLRENKELQQFSTNELFYLAKDLISLFAEIELFAVNIQNDFTDNIILKNIRVIQKQFYKALEDTSIINSTQKYKTHLSNLLNLTTKVDKTLIIAGINTFAKNEMSLIKKVLHHKNGFIFLHGAENRQQNYDVIENLLKYLSISSDIIIDVGEKKLSNIEFIEADNETQQADLVGIIAKNILSNNESIAIVTNGTTEKQLCITLRQYGINIQRSLSNSLNVTDVGNYILLSAEFLFTTRTTFKMMTLLHNKFTNMEPNDFKILDLHIKNLPFIPDNYCKILTDDTINFPIITTIKNLGNFDNLHKMSNYIDVHINFLKQISILDNNLYCLLEHLKNTAKLLHIEIQNTDYPKLLKEFLAYFPNVERTEIQQKSVSIFRRIEAKLLSFETVVFTDFNDDTFPGIVTDNFWMSTKDRESIGILNKKFIRNNIFHDFLQHAFSKKCFIISCLARSGTLAIKSRFFNELEKITPITKNTYFNEVLASLRFANTNRQPNRPMPSPDIKFRPTKFSVTEIGKFMRNPYSIYAKHILKLKQLNEFNSNRINSIKGQLLHKIIALHTTKHKSMNTATHDALDSLLLSNVDLGLWIMKLPRLLVWIENSLPKPNVTADKIFSETRGSIKIPINNAIFDLVCIADRIDYINGEITIIDYKTGSLPGKKDMIRGLSPQMYLEGAILSNGGFLASLPHIVNKMEFWHLRHGNDSEIRPIDLKDKKAESSPEYISSSLEQLTLLLETFWDSSVPYTAYPNADVSLPYDEYYHLARAQEWMIADCNEEPA